MQRYDREPSRLWDSQATRESRRRFRKRLVHDPSPAVRTEAAYHLGELSGQDMRPLLRMALEKETDHGVRRWIEAELKALRVND